MQKQLCFHEMSAPAEHKHLKRSKRYGFSMSASMQLYQEIEPYNICQPICPEINGVE